MIFLFTIIYVSGFYIPEDMPRLYGFSYEMLIVLLCASNFYKTPYEKCKEKAGWAALSIWTVLNTIFFTWFGDYNFLNLWVFLVEIIIFLSIFLHSQFRSYKIQSDEYDEHSVYICVKGLRDWKDFVHSCLFRPVSSVSVVTNGIWYGYTLGKKFHCEQYKETDLNYLIKVDLPHEFVVDELEGLVGSKWSFLNNCCHAIWKLFPKQKFTMLDSLPCHLIKTIEKIVGRK